jgi:hypothetical protein
MFNFVSGGIDRLLGTVDSRMRESLEAGVAEARTRVHVLSGHLKSTIGGHYDQATRTSTLYADAVYAAVEEMRGGDHAALAHGLNAMASFWGGTYRVDFPNAAAPGRGTTTATLRTREKAWRKGLKRSARKAKVSYRRHHRWSAEVAVADATTPIL